jgi:hypothetical protein
MEILPENFSRLLQSNSENCRIFFDSLHQQKLPIIRKPNISSTLRPNTIVHRRVRARGKHIDPILRSTYCSHHDDSNSPATEIESESNRPRKQLESSAPLGFAASGIFFAPLLVALRPRWTDRFFDPRQFSGSICTDATARWIAITTKSLTTTSAQLGPDPGSPLCWLFNPIS